MPNTPKSAVRKSKSLLKSRGLLLLLWFVPLLVWICLLLMLPVQQPDAISSYVAGQCLLTLGQVFVPYGIMLFGHLFRQEPGRLPAVTDPKFYTALVSVVLWGLLFTLYFVIHVYLPDYSMAEACDEFLESRLQDFTTSALYFNAIPWLAIESLFKREPINHTARLKKMDVKLREEKDSEQRGGG